MATTGNEKDMFALYAINPTGSKEAAVYEIEIQDAKLILTTGKVPTCELSFQIDSGKVPAGSSGTRLIEELKELGFKDNQEFVKIPLIGESKTFSLTATYSGTKTTEGNPDNPPFFLIGFNLPGATAPYVPTEKEE